MSGLITLMFLLDCTPKPSYLSVQMFIACICKGNDFPSIFSYKEKLKMEKKVSQFV